MMTVPVGQTTSVPTIFRSRVAADVTFVGAVVSFGQSVAICVRIVDTREVTTVYDAKKTNIARAPLTSRKAKAKNYQCITIMLISFLEFNIIQDNIP